LITDVSTGLEITSQIFSALLQEPGCPASATTVAAAVHVAKSLPRDAGLWRKERTRADSQTGRPARSARRQPALVEGGR